MIKNSLFSKSQNLIVDVSLQRIEIEKTSKYIKNKLLADTKKFKGVIVYNDKIMKYYEDTVLFNDVQSGNRISFYFHGIHKVFGLLHKGKILDNLEELKKLTQNKEFLDFVKNNLNNFKISKCPKEYKLRNEVVYFKNK